MVIQLTNDTVEKSTKPVVIKAFASWCPHCAIMKPHFAALEKEFGSKYIFAEFDIDQFPELTDKFKVEYLPTFIFIKNKKEVGRISGEMPTEDLKKLIERYLL